MFSVGTTPVLLDPLGTIEIEDHDFGPKPKIGWGR
jgi:hypothetical protein